MLTRMTTSSTASFEALQRLLAERSARRGHFKLASGRESTLYIDARLTTMSPEGLVLIGQLGFDLLTQSGWDAQAIGGLTLGADPVAYAIAYASAQRQQPIRAFTVRKEAKTHGTGQLIEGPFKTSDRVVIVEDVITTGGSALKAAAAVQAAGGKIVGVLAVVDREEGGKEALTMAGYEVLSLTRASEVVQHMA